jgi:hypothetical protein
LSGRSGRQLPPEAMQGVMRFAILMGVLLFGLAGWIVHRQPTWHAMAPAELAKLRMLGMVLWGVAAAATLGLFLVRQRMTDPARRRSINVVAWASAGEIPALFGSVYFFLSGDLLWYATGLVWLVLILTVFSHRMN